MPVEEFEAKYLMKPKEVGQVGLVTEYQCPTRYNSKNGGCPTNYSWKDHNAVTMVKDQGQCGSCWSFGAGAAIEGAMCKAGQYNCNSWSGVSTQQMVDCASY